MMRFYRPPLLQRLLMPGALFRLDTNGRKEIALTFDDGPDPDSTPLILDMLGSENVTAAFFCNGERADRFPGLINQIASAGHIVGNHGYLHLKGFGTGISEYVRNVEMAAGNTSGYLFRPPYGNITLSQYKAVSRKYKVVMWDLMPYDFDVSISATVVMKTILARVRPGSVIVLHDTPAGSCLTILGKVIRELGSLGYSFVNLQ